MSACSILRLQIRRPIFNIPLGTFGTREGLAFLLRRTDFSKSLFTENKVNFFQPNCCMPLLHV